MPTIRCTAKPVTIGSWTILRLPKTASAKLPSRGMVMAEGTIDGSPAQFPLEPDGKGSHWFVADKVKKGKEVTLEMEPMEQWPEPSIPADVKKALTAHPKSYDVWKSTTPMARWDWIRWIRATNEPATRAKRITVAMSKLTSGMKRPCCFNRSMCTEPAVSKGGVLLEPTH